jgi:hypothetical protein
MPLLHEAPMQLLTWKRPRPRPRRLIHCVVAQRCSRVAADACVWSLAARLCPSRVAKSIVGEVPAAAVIDQRDILVSKTVRRRPSP